METLFLLIPISLVLIGIAIWLFFRMSDSGQFDDMSGPAHAILMDDDRPAESGSGEPESRPGDPESADRKPPEH